MSEFLIPVNTLSDIAGEPRILDTDLAKRLGMLDIHKIRSLIAANRVELEMHGTVSARRAETSPVGGRPGKAYHLNEGQALVICALSRTPVAAQIRKQIIDVFMAYRQGKVVHVTEHRRRLPGKIDETRFKKQYNFLLAFEGQPRAFLQLLAGCLIRLDDLEAGQ